VRKKGNEYGAVTGRPRRCGWMDLPLLRYSNMINGTEWLVVTKLDVLDELAEIPVVVGYKIDGKCVEEIPSQDSGYRKIEPVIKTYPGWQEVTYGITDHAQLPKKAQEYLRFIQRESGAQIGMVSTGPDRDHTIFVDEFSAILKK
jgi:adenylosuccinate synthase